MSILCQKAGIVKNSFKIRSFICYTLRVHLGKGHLKLLLSGDINFAKYSHDLSLLFAPLLSRVVFILGCMVCLKEGFLFMSNIKSLKYNYFWNCNFMDSECHEILASDEILLQWGQWQ